MDRQSIQNFKRHVPAGLKRAIQYCISEKSQYRSQIRRELDGKIGVEIGGPSSSFAWSGPLPLYGVARRIDNIVFSDKTVWASHSDVYAVAREKGKTLFKDATDLSGISDGTYEFLLASHVLEHVANPVKALREWRRILKVSGVMAIIVPDRRRTFDHKRPLTTLDHMLQDFESNTGEDDLTHLEECVTLHDYAMHDPCDGPTANRERCLNNLTYRTLHHHTFSSDNLSGLLAAAGISVASVESLKPVHILALASRKK
jgi:SAM-dependent methyltransferase